MVISGILWININEIEVGVGVVGDNQCIFAQNKSRERIGETKDRLIPHIIKKPSQTQINNTERILIFQNGNKHQQNHKQPLQHLIDSQSQ